MYECFHPFSTNFRLTIFVQYLCRTQPPFLTDMALQIFNQLDRNKADANKEWLRQAIQAAIKEYHVSSQPPCALNPHSILLPRL